MAHLVRSLTARDPDFVYGIKPLISPLHYHYLVFNIHCIVSELNTKWEAKGGRMFQPILVSSWSSVVTV